MEYISVIKVNNIDTYVEKVLMYVLMLRKRLQHELGLQNLPMILLVFPLWLQNAYDSQLNHTSHLAAAVTVTHTKKKIPSFSVSVQMRLKRTELGKEIFGLGNEK